MNNYVSLVKNWYQTGQQIISTYTDNNRKKAAFVKIQKTANMHDAKLFHQTNLDTQKCIKTLMNLNYLIDQGQHFTQDEGTQLFFAITKLLQSQDLNLRRAVYVYVKQMRKHSSIYIVTSSLLKDIHHKNANFRRNSLRTIPLIVDASNLTQIQRYIKALIVDPDLGVSSAALLSGIQMFKTNQELVKKWGSEIMQKLTSKDQYVQCHALMLIGDIKRKDYNSYKKILFSLMKQTINGIAAVQYLRMLREVTRDIEFDSQQAKDFVNYLSKEVRNREDIIQIQACKLACQSSLMSNKELLEVIKILETLLATESTVKKYAVLKIFNNLLRNQFRKSLIVNVKQIEKVLTDSNTSLSSIAASILLRICSESYLQTLFSRIEKTMSEICSEVFVQCLKAYPKKYDVINAFLLNLMKKEESIEIKSEAIEVMNFQITEIGGQAKSQCIRELSKFLSATHYDRIHFQILGIISREAGKQDLNSQIFKNLISEIYLQEGAVRACGLSTLIRLAEHEEKDKQKTALEKAILQFKNDSSLEVRERLSFRTKQKNLSNYELDILQKYLRTHTQQLQTSTDHNLLNFQHIKIWGAQNPNMLQNDEKDKKKIQVQKIENDEYQTYKQIFQNHPTFKQYGVLRKINKNIPLSDGQSELYVNLRLFLFDQNFIAQFKIKNNFPNSILQNVKIQLKHSGETFDILHIIPAKSISSSNIAQCFVGLRKKQDCQDEFPQQKFNCVAKYTIKEIVGDEVKKGYQDQFSLDHFQIKLASYMAPWVFQPSQFSKQWEILKGFQENGTFQLKYASTAAAEQELLRHFGLKKIQNIEGNTKANLVSINLSGKFLGSIKVLIVLMLAFDTKLGCLLKIKIKTQEQDLTNQLLGSIE